MSYLTKTPLLAKKMIAWFLYFGRLKIQYLIVSLVGISVIFRGVSACGEIFTCVRSVDLSDSLDWFIKNRTGQILRLYPINYIHRIGQHGHGTHTQPKVDFNESIRFWYYNNIIIHIRLHFVLVDLLCR